jgi:hypothetical protein
MFKYLNSVKEKKMPGRKGYKLSSDLRQMGADPTVILWMDPWRRPAAPELLVAYNVIEEGFPEEQCTKFTRFPLEVDPPEEKG